MRVFDYAAPDGYTLLLQGEGLTLNGILFRELPYDTQKAFVPIIKAVANPQILVVHTATGLQTLGAYLARAKATLITLAEVTLPPWARRGAGGGQDQPRPPDRAQVARGPRQAGGPGLQGRRRHAGRTGQQPAA